MHNKGCTNRTSSNAAACASPSERALSSKFFASSLAAATISSAWLFEDDLDGKDLGTATSACMRLYSRRTLLSMIYYYVEEHWSSCPWLQTTGASETDLQYIPDAGFDNFEGCASQEVAQDSSGSKQVAKGQAVSCEDAVPPAVKVHPSPLWTSQEGLRLLENMS